MTTSIGSPKLSDSTAGTLLAAAHALAPAIRAAAADIERERRLPATLVDALHDAGLFRMAVPRELGGLEADALTMTQVVEELAAADGSVAWCVLIASEAVAALGWLPRRVAEQLCADPRLVLAGTLPVGGHAVEVNGGYRVTGRWGFASGVLHAAWVFGSAIVMDGDVPRRGPAGRPITRMIFVPVAEVTVHDTWSTAGLRGTGSHHFTLDDVFVPEEHSLDAEAILLGLGDAAWHPYPLYHCVTLLVPGHGGLPLGIAREALEEFVGLAQAKTPWLAAQPLREQTRIQAAVARAQAQLEGARAYLHAAVRDLWETVATSGQSTPVQRARVLLAQTHASDNAVDVVDTLARLAGTTALYTPNRLDQCLRDVRAAGAHRQVSPVIYEAAGRVTLGLEAGTPFF
jgi:alkylation response protein AidB-like acyl-CoA dehydrogenase